MTVTRDVVRDLLPLYVAGEASAETRTIVEAFLKNDPDLAREAALMREDAPVSMKSPITPMAPGRQALERTRTLLRQRTFFLAGGLFFTLLPASVTGGDGGVQFAFRDAPVLQISFLAVALVLWAGYAVTRHQMRVTGL